MEKNKVKFGLNKVHWAKILSYQEDGTPQGICGENTVAY